MEFSRKAHWENVFTTKNTREVSWFQQYPATSVDIITSLVNDKDAAILEAGGGDSQLPDALLEKGYSHLTVLDISAAALESSKLRLGSKSSLINWVSSDILDFKPEQDFVLWHDRAVFHFLSKTEDQKKYAETAAACIEPGGWLVIGAFSTSGPEKCSGLNVCRHSADSVKSIFGNAFDPEQSFEEAHQTPSGKEQQFIWNILRKKRS